MYNPGEVFRDRLKDGGEGPEMVVIPSDRFRMGDIQVGGDSDERPVHAVTIKELFALGRYEVPFAEYDRFCDATGRNKPGDSDWGRGKRPVIIVSWKDAKAYAKWLSEQTGKRYRLPTEAEWEYGARAGSETRYWWGNDIGSNNANCDGCGSRLDNRQTAWVGSFKANRFGLYDTAGNVWEWVEDCWHDDYDGVPKDGGAWTTGGDCGRRVLRGGPWSIAPRFVRAAHRVGYSPDEWYGGLGFRLAQGDED
ncbi:MAG: formylglycine-generating enzyme family protein [Deltaproteobacteria bacterium]|nr:formylglycine-generating enzyme family protein [Deltaproteobacteria bacterium]